MQETSTTITTESGIYASALLAIATHVHEHQLPAPREITRPVFGPAGITVHVDRRDHEAWVATVLIDGETNRPRVTEDTAVLHTTWAARLPDTGVRITLSTVRRLPFPTAVTA